MEVEEMKWRSEGYILAGFSPKNKIINKLRQPGYFDLAEVQDVPWISLAMYEKLVDSEPKSFQTFHHYWGQSDSYLPLSQSNHGK